jgi:hypothetical protein
MGMEHGTDYLILRRAYVDLMRSPPGRSRGAATYAMGAFSAGLGDPKGILRLKDKQVVREAEPERVRPIGRQACPPTPVVFATGADAGNQDIAPSGEAHLACRIPDTPKALFA